MHTEGVNERVRGILSALLNLPLDRVPDDGSRETLEEWDSLKHMHLVLALEEEFGIEFDDEDVSGLTTVAALARAIDEKLAAAGR
jgi:acyl carrier protein